MSPASPEGVPATAAASPWLFSRNLDLMAFGGSVLGALLLVAIGLPLGLVDGEGDGARDTPEWAWLMCVVLIDVAHVWGNLLLVYADPHELRRRQALWMFIPAAGLAVSLALVTEGELLFWRMLAALAVIHFVRQQVGWVKLYRAKAQEHADGLLAHVIDEGVVYAATCAPIAWWHAHLPRPFWWLATGDFFVPVPVVVGALALWVEVVFLIAYAIRSARAWRAGRGNPGKDLVVAGTALLWWLGIVALESDYAFTVTNVVLHGVPYTVLIAVTAQRRRRAGASLALPLRMGARVIVLALWTCAFLEELLWDRLLWHERAWLFPVASLEAGTWRPVLIALLALPQLTHYVLDAFVWRRRDNPYLGVTLPR